MFSYGTSSPSAGQTRFCWMRTPSLSWSWWKRTDLRDTALYSFTGTFTSPKLMAPLQIDLGICVILRGTGVRQVYPKTATCTDIGREIAAVCLDRQACKK